MAITISELEYFLKTAELQNITAASEQLHIMQPSLSRSIAALEDDLGVKLFDRVGRNIVLNSYGRIVQSHAIKICNQLKAMQEELNDSVSLKEHTITVLLSAASTFIPALMTQYKKREPKAIFDIMQYDQAVNTNASWDLHIFSSPYFIKNDNTVTLLKENLLLAIPTADSRSREKSVTLAEFADDDFICLQKGKGLRTLSDIYCEMANFSPRIILESDSPYTVREFIKAGVGVSLIPEITWAEIRGENISLMPVESPKCCRYICLSWNQSWYLSEYAVRFRDFLINNFEYYALSKAKQM